MANEQPSISPETAQHATEKVTLAPFALIGIFGTEVAPGALLRTSAGAFRRVEVGDKVASATVTAIDVDSVTLDRNGRRLILKLPKA